MLNIEENKLPLVAILRGVTPEEIINIAQALIDEGFSLIEVPLNSPNALASIQLLADKFKNQCLVGAGTVTNPELAKSVIETGANMIVTPNYNHEVVKLCVENNITSFIGVATMTEAFNAIQSGASVLKLFPSDVVGASGLKGMKAVLPKDTLVYPVGGVSPDQASMQPYIDAGASGFGLGSALYKPGMSTDEVVINARKYIDAYKLATV
ncbi:2-dehydro-3-deoxy-6-phosphogalactonate aldolase [Vibrio artabrorum]|uniref:2-dehydro-3-deoxy-6-phosphogalactonate aldolase n=1 Tax=Vibrio artabrorum TaxID=446374 RepID=UPI00354FD6FA